MIIRRPKPSVAPMPRPLTSAHIRLWAGLLLPLCTYASGGCQDSGEGEDGIEQSTGSEGESGGDASSGDESPTDGECADYQPEVVLDDSAGPFGTEHIPTYEFCLPDEAWRELQERARDEQYVPAATWIDGQAFDTVGLRFKGNHGTLQGCFDANGDMICRRLSLKVKFNEFTKGQRHASVKRLNFHSLVNDPTLMHEHLGYAAYRDLGLFAPRTGYGRLLVNGESLGIYAVTEQIDDRFIADRYEPAARGGNLYKEMWPDNTEPTAFDGGLEQGDDDQHEALVALSTGLQSDPSTALQATQRWTAVERLLGHLAIDEYIGNWDGVTAQYCDEEWCGNHNAYWFHDPVADRLELLPWDLDSTLQIGTAFARVPAWDIIIDDCDRRFEVFPATDVRAPACDPLLGTLGRNFGLESRADVEPSGTRYSQIFADLTGPDGLAARIRSRIDTHAALLEPALVEDGTYNCIGPWRTAVEQLRDDLPLFEERAQKLAMGLRPQPWSFDPQAINGFEATDPLAIALGVILTANSGGAVSARWDDNQPLAGSASLRIDFDMCNIRNDALGANLHWYETELPLREPTDLRSTTSLKFLATSDRMRTISVQIDSPAYANVGASGRFQWYRDVDTSSGTFSLDLGDLELPSWGTDQGDRVEDVLASVSGILISVYPTQLDPKTDLFEDGDHERGWIVVDDFELEPTLTLLTSPRR